MAKEFNSKKLKFLLGDVRDFNSVSSAMLCVDVAFHVAALKRVPELEWNPDEAIKTNLIGTIKVADAAIQNKVRHVIFSSTDKAVLPINAYGMSKSLAEKVLFQRNRVQSITKFTVYRWGNIIGSRGSVIPDFVRTLKTQKRALITHPQMSRFWLTIEQAAKFVLDTYEDAPWHKPNIPPVKSAKTVEVIHAVAELLGVKDYKIDVAGIRPGEKLHEALLESSGYAQLCSETDKEYSRKELKRLLKPFVEKCA
jgi:FlaA1/EpsC-like NDP-sugar epimerase